MADDTVPSHKLLAKRPVVANRKSTPRSRRNKGKKQTKSAASRRQKKKGKRLDYAFPHRQEELKASMKVLRESKTTAPSFEVDNSTDITTLQVFNAPSMKSLYNKVENSRRQKHAFGHKRNHHVKIRRQNLAQGRSRLKPTKVNKTTEVVVKDNAKPEVTEEPVQTHKDSALEDVEDMQVDAEVEGNDIPKEELKLPPKKNSLRRRKTLQNMSDDASAATLLEGEEAREKEDEVLLPFLPSEKFADDYNFLKTERLKAELSRQRTEASNLHIEASGVRKSEGAQEVVDDEGGSDGEEDIVLGSNFRIMKSDSTAKMESYFAQKIKTDNLGTRYKKEYLNKNVLEVLYDAFQSLDNTTNLFFHIYSSLNRSSYLCGRIWIYVMKLRTLMMDSMSHLIDEPQYLSPGFQDTREAQIAFIRDAIRVVAGAVQFLVSFTKHTEHWRFHRRPFLVQLGYDIAVAAKTKAEEWLEFEIFIFEMKGSVKRSYESHIELEQVKIIKSLRDVQPMTEIGKNDLKYSDSLDDMLNDLKKAQRKAKKEGKTLLEFYEENKKNVKKKVGKLIENNFYQLRVQLSILKDINDMAKLDSLLSGTEEIPLEEGVDERDNGIKFLKKEIAENDRLHILEEDMTIWPHQKGLPQVGPFKLLPLYEADLYLQVDMETNQYTYIDSAGGVDHMEFYVGLVGAFTIPAPVSFDKSKESRAIRKSLRIPDNAKYYSYFHPLRYNREHVDSFEPESLREIQERIGEMNGVLSPLHSIVGVGGFGYFDEDKVLIQVNGLTMGEDIFFDGPYFLPSNSGFAKAKDMGVEMTVVTLKGLGATGAMNHGWLSSKEQLDCFKMGDREFLAPDGEVRQFGGGFFYQYNNSEHPEWDDDEHPAGGRRNFFQIVNFSELSHQKARNRNTLLLKTLEYKIFKEKADWEAMDFGSADSEVEDEILGCNCNVM